MSIVEGTYTITDHTTGGTLWGTGQTTYSTEPPEPADPAVLRSDLTECVVCTSECVFVLCDVCKLAVSELRDRVLEAIGKSIEEDLS